MERVAVKQKLEILLAEYKKRKNNYKILCEAYQLSAKWNEAHDAQVKQESCAWIIKDIQNILDIKPKNEKNR